MREVLNLEGWDGVDKWESGVSIELHPLSVAEAREAFRRGVQDWPQCEFSSVNGSKGSWEEALILVEKGHERVFNVGKALSKLLLDSSFHGQVEANPVV